LIFEKKSPKHIRSNFLELKFLASYKVFVIREFVWQDDHFYRKFSTKDKIFSINLLILLFFLTNRKKQGNPSFSTGEFLFFIEFLSK